MVARCSNALRGEMDKDADATLHMRRAALREVVLASVEAKAARRTVSLTAAAVAQALFGAPCPRRSAAAPAGPAADAPNLAAGASAPQDAAAARRRKRAARRAGQRTRRRAAKAEAQEAEGRQQAGGGPSPEAFALMDMDTAAPSAGLELTALGARLLREEMVSTRPASSAPTRAASSGEADGPPAKQAKKEADAAIQSAEQEVAVLNKVRQDGWARGRPGVAPVLEQAWHTMVRAIAQAKKGELTHAELGSAVQEAWGMVRAVEPSPMRATR